MSSSQLSPQSPLRGTELFKYRQGLEKTLPEKGGQKEYDPDGSWLQAKRIEKFHEELRSILKEPRVQRNCDIVHGKWNPEKRVVEIEQEMGKFWMKMGFIDCHRKCLYPEEALFLLETSTLEVTWDGVPVSIQEGYKQFLDSSFTLEMYQVYSHLCRIGYVVIRHQGRNVFTSYERQLRLDTYMSKKKRKRQRAAEKARESTGKNSIEQHTATNMSSKSAESDNIDQPSPRKQQKCSSTGSVSSADSKSTKMDTDQTEPNLVTSDKTIETAIIKDCIDPPTEEQDNIKRGDNLLADVKQTNNGVSEKPVYHNESKWDFSEICFPDFSEELSVTLQRPKSQLLPDNVVLGEEFYTADKLQGMGNYLTWYENEEELSHQTHREELHNLEFSFQSQIRKPRSWSEYKSVAYDVNELFPHLYREGVKPLCSPEDASSTQSILNKLQVIEEYQSSSRRTTPPDNVPDFDVYAPNTKFRKSCPGLPDRRIKVLRCRDPVPDIQTARAITEYLDDKVPLLWTVVDQGSISFYDVDLISLPVDISMG